MVLPGLIVQKTLKTSLTKCSQLVQLEKQTKKPLLNLPKTNQPKQNLENNAPKEITLHRLSIPSY